ncbi:MAG: biotin/lipoyl-binding carrier protein [Alphaproteobacteria bacterium]
MAEDVETEVTGKVWKLVAKPGDTLSEDDPILILESMKMEIPVCAPFDGTVAEICVGEGDAVDEGDVMARMDED